MAGATSSMLPGPGHVFGKERPVSIDTGESESGSLLFCGYCDFASSLASEIKRHRWEVHPLLTRRKQHLMKSPKVARKRPNSESSEDRGSPTTEDEAPSKRMGRGGESPDGARGHVRRTCSAEELTKAVPEARRKSSSLGDLSSIEARDKSRVSLIDGMAPLVALYGHHVADCITSFMKPASDKPTVTSQRSDASSKENLHTLAAAALGSDPVALSPFYAWNARGGIYTSGDKLSQAYVTTAPVGVFNPPQAPLQGPMFPTNHVISQPHMGYRVCFPPSNLNTLSDVASRMLAAGPRFTHSPRKPEAQPDPQPPTTNKVQVASSRPSERLSSYAPAPQRHNAGTQSMDDERVRSLEEALRKTDCCDPNERSNVLPFRCPDGKWRMVRTKRIGGAWLVQLPGADTPSVFVPNKHQGTGPSLDDFLKSKLNELNGVKGNSPPGAAPAQQGRAKRGTPDKEGAIKHLLLQKSAFS